MHSLILRHQRGARLAAVDAFPVAAGLVLTIGRDPAAAVPFDPCDNAWVSRQHARIRLGTADPLDVVLLDLGSQHGTFLNGQRIAGEQRLLPGDVIGLGREGPQLQFDVAWSDTAASEERAER